MLTTIAGQQRRRLLLVTAARRRGTTRFATTTAAAISTRKATAADKEQPLFHKATTAGGILLAAAGVATTLMMYQSTTKTQLLEKKNNDDDDDDDSTSTTIFNWSGTHQVSTKHFWEPETEAEVEAIVRDCHARGQAIRPVGSSLSPNGIGFSSDGMLSLANLNEIVSVDTEKREVTVQAGARVSQVLDALKPYGLTLPNLASIAEQQMGGFVQVGAHGTGAKISPVDHYVTSLKLVTPSCGTLTLTSSHEGSELFHLAKVGLGCLGIVTQVTMQCVPSHDLVEHTFVLSRAEAKRQRDTLLKEHKHVRYMWIPYTDSVVVVTNDPETDVSEDAPRNERQDDAVCLQPLRELYQQLLNNNAKATAATATTSDADAGTMGFGELRDVLLAMDPLNVQHVRKVNQAEAEFWKRSEGYQTKPSEQLLQFDCGGQQWVWEVAFSTGTLTKNNDNDMNLMEQLLEKIEERQIPAPAPIEQRWSSSSSSLMSPVHGNGNDGLHSWVGIIMYLPELQSDDDNDDTNTIRQDITNQFQGPYCQLVRDLNNDNDFKIASHWAKLELPYQFWTLVDLQHDLQQRYPLDKFNAARAMLDPKRILGNSLLNLALMGGDSKNTTTTTTEQERRKNE